MRTGQPGAAVPTWPVEKSEPADCLPAGQRRQKFLCGFPESGMARFGSDLDQRFQNKPALVHCRMRNLQARLIHHPIPKQHNVDIDLAGTFLAHAKTSHRRFDPQRKLQQFSWRLIRFNRCHAVQKPRLVRDVHRLGLIQCGDRQQPARYVQLCERLAQVGRTISQVRSQRQIGGFGHQTSFAAKGARIQQKLADGIILDYLASESASPGIAAKVANLSDMTEEPPSAGTYARYLGHFLSFSGTI